MTKDEFLARFNLLTLVESEHIYKHPLPLRSAAVLIALIDTNNGLQVLLTKRASHLKHHASQISFPGGKVEQYDASLVDTALREAFEEIGLRQNNITIVGQLPPYETLSGFQITPVVGIVKSAQSYLMDTGEVAEIFHVPLQHFLTLSNHRVVSSTLNGFQHNVHFFPYKHYNIWGATAVMLKDLVAHINF
ncbi:CoA pyrophosphatase [Colwellia sp. E2M01]|uniref:CoA pyrophosphatase n=1 Tax=Colwellia sp. E2M01 TaxID=2841561 RepID=UPI001C08D8A6|nr:CoA pyrophosphatase [Colwellia sp. E2M01]MBU2871939.1 CoA pyrophosphatase [Colwellia sp. E2M01]